MNVLVVEDDPQQAGAITSLLVEDEGAPSIRSTIAHRFETACEALANDSFDSILLDLHLPDRGGLETLDGIRACSDAAIVVFTGRSDLGEEAIRRGADDYLVKGEAAPRTIRRALVQSAERRRVMEQRDEASAQHAHLAALSGRALEGARVSELFDDTCARITDGTGLAAAALYDCRGETLVPTTRVGGSNEAPEVPVPPGSPLARQLERGASFILETSDGPEAALLARLRGSVAIVVPIRSAGETVALLCAAPRHPGQLERHRAFLESVANILSTAVQRAAHDVLLERSREELRTILDAVPGVVTRFTEDVRIAYINPAATKRTGRPVAWFAGKRVEEFLPPELAVIWRTAVERVFGSGIPEVFEVGSIDGQSRDSVSLVREWSGARPTVISIATDITARVRAEARFRALYESDLLGVVFFRSDGVIFDANASFLALLDATRDDVERRHLTWTSLGAEDAPPLHERLRDVSDGVTLEHEIELPDGTRIPVVIGAAYTNEERTEAMCFVLDQRALHLAQQTISEQHLLLDSAPDAILVCSTDGEIRFWSAGATRIYGWTASEAVGRDAFTLLSPHGVGGNQVATQALQYGEWTGELRQMTKDGRPIVVQSRWARVRHASASDAILVINTDITERKELESQLLRAQRLESLGTLAGGIAHDLNNILMPIIMGVQLLRRTTNRDFIEPTLDRIQDSAKRAGDLIGQLLTFAKGRHLERELVDPATLVGDVARIATQTFPPHIEVLSAVADDVWPLWCDATQLHQVLLNLVINARDAIPPGGGTIVIGCENAEIDETFARMLPDIQPGPYSMFRVEDTGMGIPEAIREHIFDPFFTTKEVGKGTGLGLATSRSIVKNHGGVMRLESESGAGTTFYVYVPAAPNVRRQAVPEAHTDVPEGHGEWLLLIEDDKSVREITRATLETNGYVVLPAEDGAEGVAIFARERGHVSAVITDVMMPVMDGISAARAIHWLDSTITIILISGLGTPERLSELHDVPTLLLRKPFTAERLLTTVQEAIARRIAATPDDATRL